MLTSSNQTDPFLGSPRPIWIAIVGNLLVASACYAILGWNTAGAHAAARNTARFSFLWFVVGFAAPGLFRFRSLMLTSEARLIQAFAAAHMVHYAAVLILGFLAADGMFRHFSVKAAVVVAIGFSIVAIVGLTADPRASRPYRVIHTIMLYVVFLIFSLAYLKHPILYLRVFAVLLALALLLRWGSRLTLWSAQCDSQTRDV